MGNMKGHTIFKPYVVAQTFPEVHNIEIVAKSLNGSTLSEFLLPECLNI